MTPNTPTPPAEDAKLARRGKPGLQGGGQMTFEAKKAVSVTLTWPGDAFGLQEVASALDELKLLVRRARKQGFDLERFRQLIAARAEATKLALQAREAKAACDRLLAADQANQLSIA